MKKNTLTLTFIFILTIAFSQENIDYSKTELIVQFKANNENLKKTIIKQQFDIIILDSLNQEFNIKKVKLTGNKKNRNSYILEFKSEQDIYHLIELYLKTGLFKYVEPNFIGTIAGKQGVFQTTPNDTYFSRQWGLYNNGNFPLSPSSVDADIDMDLAWDIQQGDSSIIIAILDAGAKLDHPEFNGRIWQNSNESINGTDDDGNGYIDDTNGWDFANDDNNPSDDHGHGTNVTGIIGANGNNNTGYSGMDWNCKLLICKVINANNFGLYTWWSEAIYYAVDNGANVINMSVGGQGYSNLLKDAVNYAYNNNVSVVASMMNDNNSIVNYPAGFQNSIAVGSTNSIDERSSPFFWSSTSGSNYGNHIDVVAPGSYIYGLNYLSNSNYNTYWAGTSQATPLVTALSALLLAQDPDRTPDKIRSIIRNTAEDQIGNIAEDSLGFDIYYGYGRINAHQALIQNTTSINEKKTEDKELWIYPNPTSDYLFIKSNIEKKIISITNILGTEVFRKQISSHSQIVKINISELPKGIYLIQIINMDKEISISKKLIVY